MASSTNLILTFGDTYDRDLVAVYPYIDPDVEAAYVKALMEGMIANGSIFVQQPATMKSAKIVENTETLIDLDV